MTTRHLPIEPRAFGRRHPFVDGGEAVAAPAIGDDLKLFAATYAAGFLFVTLFLA
jgi:hypothetical protein